MTATTPPPVGQPAVQPQPSVAATGVGGAALLVGGRIALWIGVQLLLTGLLVLGGQMAAGRALNDAAGWWMVYGALVDLGTLGVIFLVAAATAAPTAACWGRRRPPGRSRWVRWESWWPVCRLWSSAASSPAPFTARPPRPCSP